MKRITFDLSGKRSISVLFGALALAVANDPAAAGHSFIQPFSEAELFFEQNATDEDTGLHLKVDGAGWKRLVLTNTRFQRLIDMRLRGNLGSVIGLTQLESESAEPSNEIVPKDEFLALFPEGFYFFFAQLVEGGWLVGVTELTHNLPGEAELISLGDDEVVDPTEDLLLEWETVEDPPGSAIEFYEVVAEKDEDDELLRTLKAIMLPDQTALRIPVEFLEPGKDYKAEIIAQEITGNRTSIEIPFSTSDPDGGGGE